MTHDPNPAYPVDIDRVLAVKSVREAGGRALFLAAVRELGRDEPPYDAERLARLTRVEEHFQALLLYDQLETIGPAAARRAMPVTFDPLAENWLNAPMDFTTDALAASLRAGLLADAGIPETDIVADPMPALKNVEMFNVA